MKKCKHILLPCPNECEDKETKKVKQIERMNLDDHKENECPKRAYECELCKEKETFQHITEAHIQTCANVVVDCHNVKCNQRFQRHLLDDHVVNECEYTEIDCKVCEKKVERKKWDDHRQSDIHILHKKAARANSNVIELRREVQFLLVLLIISGVICAVLVPMTLMQSLEDGVVQEAIDKKIKALQQRYILVHLNINDEESDPIVFGLNRFQILLRKLNSTHLKVYIKLLASANYPFTGRATFILLNQMEDKNHRIHKKKINIAKKGEVVSVFYIFLKRIDYSPRFADNNFYLKVLLQDTTAKPWLSAS